MTEMENRPPTVLGQASRVHSSIGTKLYLDSATADVTFVVGRSDDHCERVPVHKVVLTTASEVFETMFKESWKEQDDVRIVDATAASFKEFLQFFYLDEVQLSVKNVSDVMNLVNKYGIDDCLDFCANFIATNVTADNVCWAYELAIRFDHKHLQKFCEMIICLITKKVFQSTSFAECDRTVVHAILKLDALSCTEVELFNATMSSIKEKTEQNRLGKDLIRTHLGNSIAEFRFGSMSFEEFSMLFVTYDDLFSNKEYQDIIQLIASPKHISKDFSNNREKRSGETMLVYYFSLLDRSLSEHLSEKPYFIKNIESIVFSIDKPVLLHGLRCAQIFTYDRNGCYVHVKGNLPLPTWITISQCADQSEFDEENAVVLHTQPTDLKKTIFLPQPILLQTGSMYQIRYQQRLPARICTGVLLKPELKIDPSTTIQFHHDPTVERYDVARGLFQYFYILKF